MVQSQDVVHSLNYLIDVLRGRRWQDSVTISTDSVKYKLPDGLKLFALGEALSLSPKQSNLKPYLEYCLGALQDYEESCKNENMSSLQRLLSRSSKPASSIASSGTQSLRATPGYPPYFFMDSITVFICTGETLLCMYSMISDLERLEQRQAPSHPIDEERGLISKINKLVSRYVVRPAAQTLNTAGRNVIAREREFLLTVG